MRYLFGFLGVCALGVVPLVGCDPFPNCDSDPCEGVVCPDDGNECTDEVCIGGWFCSRECVSGPAVNGTECTFDGLSGVCVSGECGENLCEGVVCEDNDACTDDTCDYVDGMCDFTPVWCDDGNGCTEDTCNPADGCDFTTPVEDGTHCFGDFVPAPMGTCEAGVCVAPCDPASEEILQCPIREDLFCCPGWDGCMGQLEVELENCELGVQS